MGIAFVSRDSSYELRHGTTPSIGRKDGDHHIHRVRRVISHLKQNFSEPITLNDLADVACCSPWHLDRIFGQTTGVTPMAFLTSMRLEAARARVMTSEARIIEIAYDVGYNSLGSFGKRFTAIVGMAPRRLRRAADRFDVKRFASLLETASSNPSPCVFGHPTSVRGTLRVQADASNHRGFAIVALFSNVVPTIQPVACAVARIPGPFELTQVPSGSYCLLALGFTDGLTAEQTLLQSDSPRARRAPLHLFAGRSLDAGEFVLETPLPEHPPIVPVFPVLLEGGWASGARWA
jgi:AraC family transcriptional regulator